MARLEQMERKQNGTIYVLASSAVLNSHILAVACRTGSMRRKFCDLLLTTHDIDKRDGFPRHFLNARYLVLANPTQYHLRPEDQRVIGILAREVVQDHGIGTSFQRLQGEYTLDGGVMVWLYEKVRPFQDPDLDALAEGFTGYYPNKRDIFRVKGD